DDVRRVVQKPPAEREKTERGERPLIGAEIESIGGDLLDKELIVRQVLVERANDPVAIGERERVTSLFLEDVTLGVRVARDVEPISPPALAIAGRREQ